MKYTKFNFLKFEIVLSWFLIECIFFWTEVFKETLRIRVLPNIYMRLSNENWRELRSSTHGDTFWIWSSLIITVHILSWQNSSYNVIFGMLWLSFTGCAFSCNVHLSTSRVLKHVSVNHVLKSICSVLLWSYNVVLSSSISAFISKVGV